MLLIASMTKTVGSLGNRDNSPDWNLFLKANSNFDTVNLVYGSNRAVCFGYALLHFVIVLKKLAPLSQPIRSKTKTNQD